MTFVKEKPVKASDSGDLPCDGCHGYTRLRQGCRKIENVHPSDLVRFLYFLGLQEDNILPDVPFVSHDRVIRKAFFDPQEL